MTWSRAITVTIAGTDYTGDVVDGVEVYMGTQSPWEQGVNGSCRVTLITEDPDVAIGDQLVVQVADQTTTDVTVFTGTVANFTTILLDFGPLWTIQATGPLTTAGRRNVTSTITAGKDGTQVAALVTDALGQQWQEVPGAWSAQTLTWAGFDADLSNIDTPGLYDLAAIDELPANVLDELATAAFSGSGWLYETADGAIGYADSTRRENTPEADYIVVPGSVVRRDSFQAFTDEGNLANDVIVRYDGGTIQGEAAASVALYGKWERTYNTTLADAGAATAYAARRLELEAAPRTNLAGSVAIELLEASDNLTDQLLGIERNYGLIVQDVPTYIAAEGVYRGFVEGYLWQLNVIQPTLNLFVSDYSLSNFGLRWGACGPTPWSGVGASLTWQDATEALA